MDEKTLLKIALSSSIIGLFIIFIFAEKLEPELIGISSISDSLVEQDVKIQGTVSSVKVTGSVLMIGVKDETGSIKVVMFDQGDLELRENNEVEILGNVKEYKGTLEIEAKNVRLME